MGRLLLIDDDADQIELRRLNLEAAGHQVRVARDAAEGLRLFEEQPPDVVLMDLRLPRREDGIALIRAFRERAPEVRILVLTGAAEPLPEADHVLAKPVSTGKLLGLLATLFACWCLLGAAWGQSIHLEKPAEAVASLTMSAAGAAGGIADVILDGRAAFQVLLFAGVERHTYEVFLGRLAAGEHRLQIGRKAGLEVHAIQLRSAAGDPMAAHAPVLYARPDTAGRFSDVPLLIYCERHDGDGRPMLEYSVIFSNEDGGTSTRALMARWGRTTDIEYVYRVWLKADGSPARATIQSRGHKEIEFTGAREQWHPVLMPVTENNMVAPAGGGSPLRFQLAPVGVDLRSASRESVMDQHPWTYRVMAEELEREGKLRRYGTVDGHKISDPRNYLYLEMTVANRDSRIAALVKLAGEEHWSASHLGRVDYAIERDGIARTAIELPPGTSPGQVAAFGFECLVEPARKDRPAPVAGECRLERVHKAFFLDGGYRPGPSFWRRDASQAIPSGRIATFSATDGH